MKPLFCYTGNRWTFSVCLTLNSFYVGFATYKCDRKRALYISPLPGLNILIKWVTYA